MSNSALCVIGIPGILFNRLAAGAALLVAMGVPLPAAAQAPAVIHACVQPNQLLRIVGATEDCRQAETRLQWADMSAVQSLQTRVATLEGITRENYGVNVNCPGQKITDALDQTKKQLGVVVINVTGTCVENVKVTRAKTVIQAAPGAPVAEIVAADPYAPAVQIANPGTATYLKLDRMTIKGGSYGVLAMNGSVVQLSNTTVTESNIGVQVSNGAFALIQNSKLNNNRDFGLWLMYGAVTDVTNNSQINGNGTGVFPGVGIRGAVGVYAGSTLRLYQTTVSQNAGNGIFAVGGSSVWLDYDVKVESNGGHGISLSDTTVLGKLFVTGWSTVGVNNNGGWGINCAGAGSAQLYGFPLPPTVLAIPPTPVPNPQPILASGNGYGGDNCSVP